MAIGKWHLGDQPAFLPTRQGFDSFFGLPYSDDMTQSLGKRYGKRFDGDRWPPLPLMEDETVVDAPVDRNLLTKRLTERAIEFIERHKAGPFFLYFPQAMPGSEKVPFASEAFRGKSRNGLWGDAVEELDWSTGQILDKLVALGIDKNTFVIFTSDNGAPLADDITDLSRGSNLPLYGRGYTTAEGAFRVPAIMWWPGKIPAGTISNALLSTLDLLPTLAKWAGAEVPRDRVIDGLDVRPVIVGATGAISPRKTLFYYDGEQLQAVREGPWKLFLPLTNVVGSHPHFTPGKNTQPPDEGQRITAIPTLPLLFNLVEDIGSKHNVAAEHPDVVTRLTRLADQAREELGDLGRPGKGRRKIGYSGDPEPLVKRQ